MFPASLSALSQRGRFKFHIKAMRDMSKKITRFSLSVSARKNLRRKSAIIGLLR